MPQCLILLGCVSGKHPNLADGNFPMINKQLGPGPLANWLNVVILAVIHSLAGSHPFRLFTRDFSMEDFPFSGVNACIPLVSRSVFVSLF